MTKLLLSSIALFILLASVASQSTTFDTVSIGSFGAIDVDFGATYRQQNPLEDNSQMYLSLSSNETGLSPDGSFFKAYTCLAPCTSNVNDTTFVSTVDTTCNNTYRGNTTVQIANVTAWNLSTSVEFMNGTGEERMKGKDVYGFIGLGAGGNAIHNFKKDHPIFSLFLTSASSGQLIFGYNTSLTESSTPSAILPSDDNWQVSVSSLTFGDYKITSKKPLKLAFDLTRGHGIEMPIMLIDPYYSAIITNLTKIKGVEATASGMGYTFTGDLSTLPSLLIGLPNSSSWILTPKMYTTPTEDNSTTYNVLFQESLVSLLSDDVDYITLGWTFIQKFYPVFEKTGTGATISIYGYDANVVPNPQGTSPESGSKVWIFILVIFVVLIVIVLGWFQRLKNKKREIEQAFNAASTRA